MKGYFLFTTLLITFYSVFSSSCKKDPRGYDIVYPSNIHLGEAVQLFGKGGPQGSSYYWTFSDGSTSTLQNPIHTFPLRYSRNQLSHPSPVGLDAWYYPYDTVTLVVNGDYENPVKKVIYVLPYAKYLEGHYKWKDVCSITTGIAWTDTSDYSEYGKDVDITVVNDKIIVIQEVGGATYTYDDKFGNYYAFGVFDQIAFNRDTLRIYKRNYGKTFISYSTAYVLLR